MMMIYVQLFSMMTESYKWTKKGPWWIRGHCDAPTMDTHAHYFNFS